MTTLDTDQIDSAWTKFYEHYAAFPQCSFAVNIPTVEVFTYISNLLLSVSYALSPLWFLLSYAALVPLLFTMYFEAFVQWYAGIDVVTRIAQGADVTDSMLGDLLGLFFRRAFWSAVGN